MALPKDYAGQACSLVRTLEIVGERWTLLIVCDAFFGVRRFGEFVSHLQIPRAVLTERLKNLIGAGVLVLVRVAGPGRRDEYELTAKGVALWPTLRALMAWGDERYAPHGPRRILRHAADDAPLDPAGRCVQCGTAVDPADTIIARGPGLVPAADDDPVTAALVEPHTLLEPLLR